MTSPWIHAQTAVRTKDSISDTARSCGQHCTSTLGAARMYFGRTAGGRGVSVARTWKGGEDEAGQGKKGTECGDGRTSTSRTHRWEGLGGPCML